MSNLLSPDTEFHVIENTKKANALLVHIVSCYLDITLRDHAVPFKEGTIEGRKNTKVFLFNLGDLLLQSTIFLRNEICQLDPTHGLDEILVSDLESGIIKNLDIYGRGPLGEQRSIFTDAMTSSLNIYCNSERYKLYLLKRGNTELLGMRTVLYSCIGVLARELQSSVESDKKARK